VLATKQTSLADRWHLSRPRARSSWASTPRRRLAF